MRGELSSLLPGPGGGDGRHGGVMADTGGAMVATGGRRRTRGGPPAVPKGRGDCRLQPRCPPAVVYHRHQQPRLPSVTYRRYRRYRREWRFPPSRPRPLSARAGGGKGAAPRARLSPPYCPRPLMNINNIPAPRRIHAHRLAS